MAVFGTGNRVRLSPNQFHAIAAQNPRLIKFHREIERGLAAQSRQNRVGTLAADNLVERIHGQRLNVSAVRAVGVRHYCRGVRVRENDEITFLFKCFYRLNARVVELAPLPNDNGSRANNQNLTNIRPLHVRSPYFAFFDTPHLSAAPTSPSKSGCGAVGRDLNSGWNCPAMK